jgi:hypothetical protein
MRGGTGIKGSSNIHNLPNRVKGLRGNHPLEWFAERTQHIHKAPGSARFVAILF